MFKPVFAFIGLRYTRAKRRNHFISFISAISMLGIALGVAVLITVLSVMNGFDDEIRTRLFSMAREVTVTGLGGQLSNWSDIEQQVRHVPGVTGVAPYVSGQGMFNHAGQVQGVMVTGINPQQEAAVSALPRVMTEGKLSDLQPGKFNVILGRSLAETMGLDVGDKVTLITPTVSVTPLGVNPRLKSFNVVGIFSVGQGFSFDEQMAYINLQDAQKLFLMQDKVTGLNVKTVDLDQAPLIASNVLTQLNGDYLASDWTAQYGQFFKAIALEKNMMSLILMLIIAVAAFNLVSSLVMVVTDKQADIAILQTMGATAKTILGVFVVQGAVVGLFGTLMGLLGGVVLALNVTSVVNFIQNYFHLQLISPGIYYLDYLPSHIKMTDLSWITVVSVCMSLLATLYPAWRATRVKPAEALRYE